MAQLKYKYLVMTIGQHNLAEFTFIGMVHMITVWIPIVLIKTKGKKNF